MDDFRIDIRTGASLFPTLAVAHGSRQVQLALPDTPLLVKTLLHLAVAVIQGSTVEDASLTKDSSWEEELRLLVELHDESIDLRIFAFPRPTEAATDQGECRFWVIVERNAFLAAIHRATQQVYANPGNYGYTQTALGSLFPITKYRRLQSWVHSMNEGRQHEPV